MTGREHTALLAAERELAERVGWLAEGYDSARGVQCAPGCDHLAAELQAARRELERVSSRLERDLQAPPVRRELD